MSKNITVKNITRDPAVPIGLMVVKSGGPLGESGNYIQISTDGIPVPLTEGQYENCKEAVARYVDAEKLKLSIIETKEPEAKKATKVKPAPKAEAPEADDSEEKALRARGKELGVKSWHVMGLDNLKAAIAEKEAEES